MAAARRPGGHDFIERKPATASLSSPAAASSRSTATSISRSTRDQGHRRHDGRRRAATPVGKTGWLPDISTNLSYIGVRGFQSLGGFPASFVYQLETQIDISAASGTSASNSNTSDVVKGA